MTYSKLVFLFILWLSVSKCSSRQNVRRYKEKFEHNRTHFELAVESLKKQNLALGRSIPITQLPDTLQNVLLTLSVVAVTVDKDECPAYKKYEFRTNWATTRQVYFIKNSCHSFSTSSSYYTDNSERIEIWQLGDGWIMLIDHDFI